jgi:hypothetical protein
MSAPERTHRRRRWILIGAVGVVVVLAVTGIVVWRTIFNDTTTAVPVNEAVNRYRNATTVSPAITSAPASTSTTASVPSPSSSLAATTTTIARLTVPPAGVYVYATKGDESIDALTGAHHVYPAQTTITVVDGGCGAQLHWAPLEERSEDWDLCPTAAGGLDTTAYTSFHKFFGQDDRETYVCPPNTVYLPAGAKVGQQWTVPCTHDNTVDSTLWTVVDFEPVTVGQVQVPSVHILGVDASTDPDGSTSNTRIDLWLDASNALPLRHVESSTSTNKTAVGDVHYREQIQLTLTDLQPRR